MFKMYKESVEKESSKTIKCLRYDRGGEFASHELNIYYDEHGINR